VRLDHLDGGDTILFFASQFRCIDIGDDAGQGAFDKIVPLANLGGYGKCLIGFFDVNIESGHVDLLDLLVLSK
jgi:hypothetical protein